MSQPLPINPLLYTNHLLFDHLVPQDGCEQHLLGRRTLLPKSLLCHHTQSEPQDDKHPLGNVATDTMSAV